MTLENISDTARWVAVYRAMETERPDAIFRDPFAKRLAGARGEAIVNEIPRGRSMAWSMIVRTAVFDEIIMKAVKGGGVDLVINLAAGLDARPWRLDLPPSLRWVDVDLPEILRYKVDTLREEKPRCHYQAIEADLRDGARRQAIFSQLGATSTRALIVTEGLLIYLEPEDVGTLARDLHAQPRFQWWLIDLASQRLLALMQRMWGKRVDRAEAPFRFAPATGTAFFRTFGWRELEFRGTMDESRRLKREMRLAWLFRFVAWFYSKRLKEQMRRFGGAVLLERE